ncbi:MAG: NAD(+) kinase, partial [Thermomonas sp.]
MTAPRLALLASPAIEAQAALADLERRYGAHPPAEADVIVALGGDGFMLQTLHRHGALGRPVY